MLKQEEANCERAARLLCRAFDLDTDTLALSPALSFSLSPVSFRLCRFLLPYLSLSWLRLPVRLPRPGDRELLSALHK